MGEDTKTSRLKSEIRAQLGHVCGDMPEQDFETLVQNVASNEMRADQRLYWGGRVTEKRPDLT